MYEKSVSDSVAEREAVKRKNGAVPVKVSAADGQLNLFHSL